MSLLLKRSMRPIALAIACVLFCSAVIGILARSSRLDAQRVDIDDARISVRIVEGRDSITLHSEVAITALHDGRRQTLPAGAYRITLSNMRSARTQVHLFAKTFAPGEKSAQSAFIREWKKKGYETEVVPIGNRFSTESGRVLDNRVNWMSIVQASTQEEASAAQARLEAAGQYTWMRTETTQPGSARLHLIPVDGSKETILKTPVVFRARGAIGLADGPKIAKGARGTYAGDLECSIGTDGKLMVVEKLPIEEYLRGVVPAEMPAEWPMEALKAQAVAARSEVLANLSAKHTLEGYDFCALEHCRAYRGSAAGHPRSDAALAATRGAFLVNADRIVEAVFSSNCGGWTEHNETVWSAPPEPVLRGIADLPRAAQSRSPEAGGVVNWLLKPQPAYCSEDTPYFRWRRTYTSAELSEIVNRRHAVGQVEHIDLGDRGVSGRLKWVRIRGRRETVTLRKDLPIRLAFGGLPSTLFLVDEEPGAVGARAFTFIGGGHGHGVGLCQHGARGMAAAGIVYTDILKHYYADVVIERYR